MAKKPPFRGKICRKPFEYFEIGTPREGRVPCYSCCPTILPNITGDLAKQSLDEIWNSEEYKKIRASILDGSYKYCRTDLCPEIQSDNLLDIGAIEDPSILDAYFHQKLELESRPKEINLSYDQSCNLACPSCREDFITSPEESQKAHLDKITNELLNRDLSDTKVIACSSGDPFVGEYFKKFLYELEGSEHEGLKIQIMTNGVLFNKRAWEKMYKIHSQIEMVCISIDAATEETYGITRKGGSWKLLMENLQFLSLLRERGEIPFLRIDFVVQDHNYQEIPAFIKLGEKLKVDQVFFQKVANWGTFSQEEYEKRCIYSESHPQFNEFYKVITSKELKKPIVNPGNFGHWIGPVHKDHRFNWRNAIIHSLRKRLRLWKVMGLKRE